MKSGTSLMRLALIAGVGLLATACERPPVDTAQWGYRGLGMEYVSNPRLAAARYALDPLPETPPPIDGAGQPLAKDIYKNVKVLGDLDAGSFVRLMTAMTQWVGGEQGCNYCHPTGNFEDETPNKIVSRRMLQMTQHINSQWKSHVGEGGVTCFTCHRGGRALPPAWTTDPKASTGPPPGWAGWRYGQNMPAPAPALASLPADPFTPYLLENGQIRVTAPQAAPSDHKASIQHTEWTYALMMHMSQALGVNCTYCHNTRNFASWEQAPAQRATAWYGIRMVRDLNNDYLVPLGPTYVDGRRGVLGDAPKANCTTCHQGAFKPLFGTNVQLASWPELRGPIPVRVSTAAATALSGTLGAILFAVDKSELTPQGRDTIAKVAGLLAQNTAVKVDLSGYTDKTGNVQRNLELGKQRAFAVRDALKAAGVPEDRINLKKPEFVIGGASDESRRVDINVAP